MKYKKIILAIIVLLISIVYFNNNGDTISINMKSVESSNNSVSERDLALLASFVYEPVPNDSNYDKDNSGIKKGCIYDDEGHIIVTCYFSNTEKTAVIDGYDTLKYIEGLSARKKNWFTSVTTTLEEPGHTYYSLDFSDLSELDNWEIVNSDTSKSWAGISNRWLSGKLGWSGTFDAITFKKGDNYVISYRGTDFPDFLEWIVDFLYAFGKNGQSDKAYAYATHEYERILKENSNAKIYITGHSLGAYLAQVGGAAIVLQGYNKTTNTINYSSSSHLEGVAYFNGMGVDALSLQNSSIEGVKELLGTEGYTKKLSKALIWLGTHNNKGQELDSSTSDVLVNYSDTKYSSGRLKLYRINGDPVSAIGLHYGEIWELEPAADAINNHAGNHSYATADAIKAPIQSLKDAIKSWKEEWFPDADEEESSYKFTETISKSLSSFIEGVQNIGAAIIDTSDDIKNALFGEKDSTQTEINLSKVSFGDSILGLINRLLNEISSNVQSNNLTSGIYGIFEAANIGHETDSFICFLDNNTTNSFGQVAGTPKITATAVNLTEEALKGTNLSEYRTDGSKNYILEANVSNGCATKYIWYETDSSYNIKSAGKELQSGYNSQLIINKNTSILNGTVRYFVVKVKFDNTLHQKKLVIDKDGKYTYKLINTGEDKSNVSSEQVYKFRVSYANDKNSNDNDNVVNRSEYNKPICSLTSTEVELYQTGECKTSWKLDISRLIPKLVKVSDCSNVRKESKIVILKCTDDVGFSEDLIGTYTKFNNIGNIINLNVSKPVFTNDGKTLSIYLTISGNKTSNIVKPIIFVSGIHDKAGNSATFPERGDRITVSFKQREW